MIIVDASSDHVATNHHVIEQADEIRVTTNDGRELKAELLGADPEIDIALLQIPAENLKRRSQWPTPAACGSATSWWRSATLQARQSGDRDLRDRQRALGAAASASRL